MKGESASLSERPDALIVAAPRQAKLNAIVLIIDAEAVAHGLKAVRQRERILALVGEVDDGRPEHRPVALELHAAGEPQLLLVAQIFDGRVDVAVEPQIADLDIGLFAADGEVELLPP